jgi:hypothetical protein
MSARITASLFGAALALTVTAAAEDGPNCYSSFTKVNVCEYARRVQAEMAPLLPQKMNVNITLTSILTIGPRVVIVGRWQLTKAEMDSTQRDASYSHEQWATAMQQATQNYVCGVEPLAAFVRLGGQMQYNYVTSDNFLAFSPLVDRCK